MALQPIERDPRTGWLRLERFEAMAATRVATWVSSPLETYWLAPRNPPPITPTTIVEWGGFGREQLLLYEVGDHTPVGYGEINALDSARGEYWLGHLLIDPSRRGEGLGRRFTGLLTQRAFSLHGARRVTLVVFPENRAGVACYQAAGFEPDGFETHQLPPPYSRTERLLRMAIHPHD